MIQVVGGKEVHVDQVPTGTIAKASSIHVTQAFSKKMDRLAAGEELLNIDTNTTTSNSQIAPFEENANVQSLGLPTKPNYTGKKKLIK